MISLNNKEPTIVEIAKELGMSKEEVVFALDAIQDPVSLFEPVYHDDGDAIFIMDQVSDSKNLDENWISDLTIRDALERLNDREK